MRNIATSEYYRKLKAVLPVSKFQIIEYNLLNTKVEKLEAFWNIIVAGYPVDFALSHYERLFKYASEKDMDFNDALTTYVCYPKIGEGIYVTKTRWFELN